MRSNRSIGAIARRRIQNLNRSHEFSTERMTAVFTWGVGTDGQLGHKMNMVRMRGINIADEFT